MRFIDRVTMTILSTALLVALLAALTFAAPPAYHQYIAYAIIGLTAIAVSLMIAHRVIAHRVALNAARDAENRGAIQALDEAERIARQAAAKRQDQELQQRQLGD